MRHLILSIACFLFFSSCTKEQGGDPINPNESVPKAVILSMKSNFPTAENIKYSELVKGELWHVDFKESGLPNEVTIFKDGKLQEWGVKKDNSSFTPIVLQDVIQKYLDANYPNAELLSVTDNFDVKTKEKIGQSVYILFEKKNYVLEFDLLGAFITAIEIDSNGNSGILDEWTKWEIKELSMLPENIRNYLDQYHSNYELYSGTAVKGPNDYLAYYITIKINELLYAYEFDKDANVLSLIEYNLNDSGVSNPNYTENINDASQIPAAISQYFDNNYSGWQYIKGYKTLNVNKEVIEYLLVILANNEYYYVIFDSKEQFLKVEKGGSSGGSSGDNTQENINDVSAIPAAIQNYLNTNFDGWVFLKGYVVYNSSGEKIESLLVIQIVDDVYYVTFDGKDNFLGAKKG